MKPGTFDIDEYRELRPRISVSLNLTQGELDKLYSNAQIGVTEYPNIGAQWEKASGIKMKPIHWLWPGLIARGKVSIVAGHPGLGKSQWSTSLAAVVTTGGLFPVTRDKCELGSVLMLSAEDDPADTAVPRLKAAGADLERVQILKAIKTIDEHDGREKWRAFNLQEDLIQLEKQMVTVGDVSLIVIDPVSAYLGAGVDSHRNSEIRALFMPVRELAERCDVAIVCITHLNKSSNADALLRVIESVGMVAAARAGFIIGKHPEDETRRVFSVAKNNIGADDISFGFRIESASFTIGDQEIKTSMVSWELEPLSGITANDLVQVQIRDPGKLDEAEDYLCERLSQGSVHVGTLGQEAKNMGISKRTLERAKSILKVETKWVGRESHWVLPAGTFDNSVTANSANSRDTQWRSCRTSKTRMDKGDQEIKLTTPPTPPLSKDGGQEYVPGENS